jgi:hypothetical protein
MLSLSGNGVDTAVTANQQFDVFDETLDYLLRIHDVIGEIKPFTYSPGPPNYPYADSGSREGDETTKRSGRRVLCGSESASDQKLRELKRLPDECDAEVTFDGE